MNRPQQEIDEILDRFLRDDMSLDEAEQAVRVLHERGQDVVTRLLAMLDQARPEEQTIASVLLTAVGDERLVPRLLERVQDPDVDDVCKIKVITAILQLTPHADANELFAHLHDYRGALEAARREHLLLLQSPQDLALWLQSVESEMSPASRLQLIENSVELGDPAAVPMLICLCYDPDEEVALAAMDAVERFKDMRAIRPLAELGIHHPLEAVRQEAAKTADRLRIRTVLADRQPPSPIGPISACYLTPIDGAGAQVAFVVRTGGTLDTDPDDSQTIISTILSDTDGIRNSFGFTGIWSEIEKLLQDYIDHGIVPVPVTHEQCLAVLDEAIEINWRYAELPISYLVWREWIEQDRVPVPEAPLAVPHDRRALRLAECGNLLLQDEFLSWIFPPESIGSVEARYREQTRRQGALDRTPLSALLREGVRELVDEPMRRQLGSRLRRMAPLLQVLYEGEEVWQWAVVAAEALDADSGLPPEEHPFLLAMLACTLENALGAPIGWFDEV